MTGVLDDVSARYVYRVEADVACGRAHVRCYLVERLEGTNVVARVAFLGALPAPRRRAVARAMLGRWCPTPSTRHSHALVARRPARR